MEGKNFEAEAMDCICTAESRQIPVTWRACGGRALDTIFVIYDNPVQSIAPYF